MVTFQCEKWGMTGKAYLLMISGVLLFSALCYFGAISYENRFTNQIEEDILKFLEEAEANTDENQDERSQDGSEEPEEKPAGNPDETSAKEEKPSGPGEKLFTTSFIVLLAMAAVGGLQITYISTMPFIMFGGNFSHGDIVYAAQAKSITMIFGSFPVGLLVDKLGQRTLVNGLTNLVAMIWWLPFLLDASWVKWPMVGFFSCIDAAWVASLYALPLSMVHQDNMGFAMILVNGIQWFSCIFGLPLVSYIEKKHGMFGMGCFIFCMYTLAFFLSMYLYFYGDNQEVANSSDHLKRCQSDRLVVHYNEMAAVTADFERAMDSPRTLPRAKRLAESKKKPIE